MDRNQIDLYEDGGRKLIKAIEGLDQRDLTAFPVSGTWSIQQLVLHVTDSDLVLAERMKRVIAEDRPALLAFDENAWIKNLYYDLQSAHEAAALFDQNRRVMTSLLRVLPDDTWKRVGVHNERGEQTLEEIFSYAVKHLDHHLKFLYDKREKLGKLMW